MDDRRWILRGSIVNHPSSFIGHLRVEENLVRMLLPHGIPACPEYPPRAALAIATIPTLILSFLFQRQITKGMTMGAIK